MSSRDPSGRIEIPLQRLDSKAGRNNVLEMRTCSACNKEFTVDEYLDHVYENDDCYRAYLASEKKEMSKQ